MEAASNAEPNRSYSWRSDFHISPKNCKWLQDNLNDMEMKIKAMIKLVEEDADSFARRAEMYYKKRPELMKLVEEFYRAYRALAERYDRVAGTLREANRTIAAVFPNHSELLFPEEASTGLADVGDEEAGERAPFSDKEELKRMSWLFSDEVLKKISENMFKNLNLKEDRGKDCQCEKLQEELSNLSEENKNHKSHILFESARAGKAETESNNLKEAISKLRVELEATFHQFQASQERIMNLEAEISQIQDEFQHLNDEMSIKASKLNISEDRCRSLEQENSCLKLEVDKLNQVLIRQREDAFDFVNENQNLRHQLNSESKRADQVESDSISLKDAITKLKSEMATALLQYHVFQGRISDLESEIRHINDEISVKVCKLNMSEDQCLSLREENKSLQRKLDEHKQRLMRQDEEISMRDEELHRVKQTLEDMHQQNIHAEIKENSLQLEVNMLKQRLVGQEEELSKREKELAKLKRCIEDEWHKHMNSEWAQQSLVNLHYQSDEKLRVLSLEIQNKNDKLKRMELRTTDLEEELRQLYNENNDLIDKSISTVSKIVSLQDEIISLRGLKQNLEKELQIHAEESRFLQQELSSIENERSGFEKRHRELTDKLGEMQFSKAGLEEELRHLRNENYVLKEESYASLSKILSLQDEIISLRESNCKLEDALQFHVEKKEALQQELSCLKNEKNDTEKRHHDLTQQIERVNCNVDSLQALIMEFHDGCEGPKCKKFEKLEDEKPFYFDKFRLMEDLPEKNAIYNISLSNMNTELICLQEKIKGLEEYFQSLHGNILKTVRVSHAEDVNQKIEKVSATNSFLENSLSDLNVEFNILRGKVKNLEESCLSFCDQKSHLIAENSDLIPQAKRVGLHLQSLENRFLLFEENIKNTEEKDKALHQVSTLNNQIYLLKETIQAMMEELEEEQYKTVKSEIDSFIMLQVLVDMKDKNLSLSEECHKYKEKLRRTKELIFGLKHEWTFQEKRLALLSEDIAKHFEGINVKIKADDADRDCKTSNKGDDGVLHIILDKITVLQNYLPGAKEEIHQLLFERSLFSTFLEQLGLNLTELSAQREVMKEESFKLESSILQSTNQDFFETSKKSSSQQLLDLNGTRKRLQAQIQRLLEQNKSLTEKVYKLRVQNEMLDEENEIILEKAITDEFLSLILWSFNDEKSSEIEWLIGGVEHLYLVTNELGQEMRSINRKMRALESENMHLKEECRNHIVLLEDKIQKARNALGNLNVKTQTGTKLSEWREMEIQDTQNLQIFKVPEDDILESNKVKLVREKLENLLLTEENALKSTEISRLHRLNELLEEELHKMHNKVKNLRMKENLTSTSERNAQESKCCKEVAVLLQDLHASSILAMVLEEEVIGLMQTIKGLESEILQLRMALKEEIALRTSHNGDFKEKLDVLERENVKLKAELNAYLPIVVSLDNDITSLEEHTLSLANRHILNNKRKQGSLFAPLQRKKSSQPRIKDYTPRASAGILELKRLRAKVKVLQKAVTDTDNLSETTTEGAARKSKARKSKGREGMMETRKKKDIIFDLEKSIESGKHDDLVVDYPNKVPEGKFEQTMKDIELDHVLSTPWHQDDFRIETEDLNLRVWEPVIEKNIEYHQIENIEKDARENLSSELVIGKELAFATLENPAKKTQLSHQEWVKSVSAALSADAHKLLVLGKTLEELKRITEFSESNRQPSVTEFNVIKVQLREAEGGIIKLIDLNCKLTKMTENFVSSDSNKQKRQFFDRVQRVSEKTSGLELKLQKIQVLLSKIQEKHKESKTPKAMERRSKLPLKDLIYGKRSEPKQMKRRFCDCMKLKTK